MKWVQRSLFIVIFIIKLINLSRSDCTWNKCPDSSDQETIYVHIVPHTHDDMGWKKTADDYYTGAHPLETLLAGVIYPGVQYVINTVLDELEQDPNRRFSYCETGFLTRWLEDTSRNSSSVEINKLKSFVENGQLEFIGGGWVQPDEAATHYVDLIDQYTLGLRKLQSALGTSCTTPKVAWQIDPFGHSREHANLAVMMGYEGLFFAREHYLEHTMRLQEKKLEFMWDTSDDLNNKILSGAFYDHYNQPDGFCWDVSCMSNNPIIDDPDLNGYNVNQMMTNFTQVVLDRHNALPHNHVLMLMGSDFHYGNANMWFTNLDKLIYYMNKMTSETKIKLFYSTPTCYLQAIKGTNTNWTSKTSDFFPYAYTTWRQGEHSYWSGYFTSKPAFKGLVRQSSSFLQLVRKLSTIANLYGITEQNSKELTLERALALSQHHDAITGTSKDYVTQDYIARIYNGWNDAEAALNSAIRKLSQIGRNNAADFPKQQVCRAINETDCYAEIGTATKFAVSVYNSHIQQQQSLVRIPLYKNFSSVQVLDSEGTEVLSQVIKTHNNTALTGDPQITNKGSRQASLELNFLADVDPLGFRTYFVNLEENTKSGENIQPDGPVQSETIIQNEYIMLHFDASGRLQIYHDLETNIMYNMTQDFLYYLGYGTIGTTGGNRDVNQSSGAYVMRPAAQEAISIAQQFNISMEVVNTSFSMEVRQHFSNWASQTIRLVKGKRYAEFEWTIGPIPDIFYEPFSSKEIITRYSVPSIISNNTFYTDANGRQLIKRVKNFAPDYTYVDTEPVSANYYPVNSRIIVSDDQQALVVLTDRSEGGTSLEDGTVELLVHRRTYFDDGFGVGEPLNEMRDGRGLVVRGKHWVFLAPPKDLAKYHRNLALEMFNSPVVAFSTYDNFNTYQKSYITRYSAICNKLPENINLLTLKQLNTTTFLIRLEHIYQNNEDGTLSQPQMVDINEILPMFLIKSVQEMKLAANDYVQSQVSTNITLNPMEIRTFILNLVGRLTNFSCNNQQSQTTPSTNNPSSATTSTRPTTTPVPTSQSTVSSEPGVSTATPLPVTATTTYPSETPVSGATHTALSGNSTSPVTPNTHQSGPTNPPTTNNSTVPATNPPTTNNSTASATNPLTTNNSTAPATTPHTTNNSTVPVTNPPTTNNSTSSNSGSPTTNSTENPGKSTANARISVNTIFFAFTMFSVILGNFL